MSTEIQESSSNVFTDLGFEPEETQNLRILFDLFGRDLEALIEDLGLTQTAAVELLQVTQPRISNLVRGKIERFSVDKLIEMLGHAGANVSFVVNPGRQVA